MSGGEEWDLSAVVRRGAATTTTQSGGGRNNNNAVGEKALTFDEEEEEKGYFSFPNLSNVGGFDFNTNTISSSSSSIDELQDSYKPFLSNPITTMTSAAAMIPSFSNSTWSPKQLQQLVTTTTMNPKALLISPTTTTTTTLLINSVYGGGGESSSDKQQQQQQQQQSPQQQVATTQLQVQVQNSSSSSSRQQAGASTSFPILSMQHPPQPSPPSRKRKNQQKRMVCHLTADNLSDDLWAWRKYGQKPIKGSPYPRNYYRCSSSKGCGARKQVERSNTDSETFIVTYTGEHTHPRPTHRNSLAGSTRNKIPVANNNNVVGISDSAQPQPIITDNVPSPPSNTSDLSPKTPWPVVDPLAFLEDLMNLDDDNKGFDGNADMIDEMLDEDDGEDYFFSGRSNN
ncbi:hypothetical protein ACFE04_028850 [Oxalis oulophora]